jgi:hypothetical protein
MTRRFDFAPGEYMKNVLRTIAFGAALTMAATAVPAIAAITSPEAQDQDRDHDRAQQQHPEYSNNSYYKMGNREGYQDYQKKTHRKMHHHKYRSDDDRQAHDYGYQQGLQGQRGDHDDNNRPR